MTLHSMQVNEENAKIWHRLLKDLRSYYVAKLMFTVEEIPVCTLDEA